MATASDDDVSVFCHNLGGVLLTHDHELLKRRRRNTFGHHILLRCMEWEASNAVDIHLADIVAAVHAHRDALCAALTLIGLKVYPSKWL